MFELYDCAKPIDKASSSINSVLFNLIGLYEKLIGVDCSIFFVIN